MGKEIDLLNFIKNNPKTNLKDIISKNNITEITTKKILFDLLSKNLIKYKSNYYYDVNYIDEQSIEFDKDTFFGVFIKKEHKDIIKYLFKKITDYWIKSKNSKPTNTQIYKILVQLNNKLYLNLPIVWYKFGQIPVVSYNSNNLDIINLSNIIPDKEINNMVIENLKLNSRQIKLKQYNLGSTDLHQVYDLKEKMISKFYENDFMFIKNNFETFFRKIPYFKDENQTMNSFYEFLCVYNNLNRKLQLKNNYKELFNKLFNKFWDIIAINNFKNNIKEYYRKNNINILNFNFNLKIEEEEFNTLLENFNSEIDYNL